MRCLKMLYFRGGGSIILRVEVLGNLLRERLGELELSEGDFYKRDFLVET